MKGKIKQQLSRDNIVLSLVLSSVDDKYSPLCQSGIREYRKGFSMSIYLSIHPPIFLSVHPRAFLYDGRMDFVHIGYHDQVLWAADTCKIEFGSVPNLSNYGNLFKDSSVYCDI